MARVSINEETTQGYYQVMSTDTKPTQAVADGATLKEIDTGRMYEYSNANVNPVTGNGWWEVHNQLLEKTSYGVLSGLEVTAQSTPDMTVNMSAGVYYKADGTRQDVLALTSQVVPAADTVEDRIDLIYKNAAGVATYVVGILEIDAVAGARSYTITTNAAEGDTVVIDGQTFTAIRTTPGTDEYNLGVSTTATATALYNILNANTNITDLFTVTNPSAGVVRLVETSAGGLDTPGEAAVAGDIEITNGAATASKAAIVGERDYTVAVNPVPVVAGARQYTLTVNPDYIRTGARNYTVATNAAEDDTITIEEQILTAIRTTPSTDEFNIGVSTTATATALAAILASNAALSALYDVTNPEDGVVLLTEKVPGAGDTPGAAEVSGDVEITNGDPTVSAAVIAGARTYTITDRAETDDEVAILGQTLTCVTGVPGADEFEETGTIAACATNLAAALAANATIDALYAVTNPSAGVIVLTEKVPGAGDTPGTMVPTGIIAITNGDPDTSTAAVAGARSYTVATNASHKDTITIDAEVITALKSAAGTDEFVPGIDATATALVLIDLINANAVLSAIYTAATGGDGVISVTEDTPGGEDTPGAAEFTGTVVITNGDPTVSKPADTIGLNGETFTAVDSGAGTDEFVPGIDATATALVLIDLINANATLSALYTATTGGDGIIVVTEDTPGAGDTPGEASVDGTVEITNGAADTSKAADTITIDGETFTAVADSAGTDEFVPGVDATATALVLVDLVNANATLHALYTATSGGDGIITITETSAGGGNTPGIATYAGAVEITNGDATTSDAAVAGARDYTVTVNASHKDTVEINSEVFTALKPAAETDEFVPGAGVTETATALYNLVNANAVLSAIYTATNPSAGVLVITETSDGGLDTPGEAAVTGDIEITNGEATESVAHEDGGTVPATPAGGVALAEINVDANQTIVETADITKKRTWTTPGVND